MPPIENVVLPAPATARPTVYHVSPWRLAWIWIVFGPMVTGCIALGLFADSSIDGQALMLGGAFLLAVLLGITWLVRRARLEISEDGICLRQTGFRLEAKWSDVSQLVGERGREAFVTRRPVGGACANRLAAAASTGYAQYDEAQQSLLDEHRLIPIEAFAWHLRNGSLGRDIRRYAPRLAADVAAAMREPVAVPMSAADRRRNALVAGLIALGLAVGFLLIGLGERAQAWFFSGTYALLDPLLALSAGYSAYRLFKRRSWLLCVLTGLLALVMIGWTLRDWQVLARLIG